MDNSFLEFLLGGGEGFFEDRERRKRHALNLREQALKEELGRGELGVRREDLGFRREQFGKEFPLKEREVTALEGLRSEQVKASQSTRDEVIPGGMDINLPGGRKAHVPGRLDVLSQLEPYLRAQTEGEHRQAFPHLYRNPYNDPSAIYPKDVVNWRMKLLTDLYGKPGIADEPGAVKRAYEEALGIAQSDSVLSTIFGSASPSDFDVFLKSIQSDPRSRYKEGFNEIIAEIQATNPEAWQALQPFMEEIAQYEASLPRRAKGRVRGKAGGGGPGGAAPNPRQEAMGEGY